jgi:broad specificity phosphatase PhoE
MRIILIRHPLSKSNLEGIAQHPVEGEIDGVGVAQMEKLLARLREESFDRVYSSDAKRCGVLANGIAKLRSLQVDYSDLFREIDNGEWWYKKKADMDRLSWVDPINTRPPRGESLQDLWERSFSAREYIVQRGGERVILVSHGLFLKFFLGSQIGLDVFDAFKSLKFSNCALSEITLDKNSCRIEYINNRDYLR